MNTLPAVPMSPPLMAYLPVSLFGSVMGLTGLSLAWRLAAQRFGLSHWISDGIGAIAITVFLALAVAYGIKIVSSRDAFIAEFRHPIAGNLFGTVLISLLLLPLLIAPLSMAVARGIWAIGAIGMLLFAWVIVDRWLTERQQPVHATPAWIIPVVGMMDVPLALPALDLPQWHGAMVVGLAVGFFFTLPLFTLIVARLIFEAPMPEPLQPTLMILLAPFAVGTSTYVVTVGRFDLFAQVLFALTLFLLPVLALRLRHVAQCCPFKVSWWAVSFPLAASVIAALRFDAAFPSSLADALAVVLLGLVSLAVAALLLRTLLGIAQGELKTLST